MLWGSGKLHGHLCQKLGLDPKVHSLQTSTDGKFSVEFVECLASCRTAPVMMCNEDFHEASALIRLTRSWTNVRHTMIDSHPTRGNKGRGTELSGGCRTWIRTMTSNSETAVLPLPSGKDERRETYQNRLWSQATIIEFDARRISTHIEKVDEPGYAPDIECYMRHGGYETLRKVLAMRP